jgi:hypothetical protein
MVSPVLPLINTNGTTSVTSQLGFKVQLISSLLQLPFTPLL